MLAAIHHAHNGGLAAVVVVVLVGLFGIGPAFVLGGGNDDE